MNVLLLVILSLIIYFLAYKFYADYISKSMRVDDSRLTPAHLLRDDLDYVPSTPLVVFSHHFATIAGAGPILGPTIAFVYGLVPVWLWVVIGAVFLGAVHDYTSLFISLRERGRSIAEITAKTSGRLGFFLYISFTILLIVLVCAAFLQFSVQALTSFYPLDSFKVDPGRSLLPLHTFVREGVQMVRIGGIATTSVIIITAFAPLVGYLLYRKRIRVLFAFLIATIVAIASVLVGFYFPVQFHGLSDNLIRLIWMIILSVYVLFASALPVFILLQPRDFTNAILLYVGMALLFLSAIFGGLMGVKTDAPFIGSLHGAKGLGFIWPVMFITIACGAISGFHSLVSSGTTAKQCDRENNARVISFGGMLLESLLAVLVILALAAGLGFSEYLKVAWPETGASNPVLAFALGVGNLMNKGLGFPLYIGTIFGILMLEGFLVTTLDSAVRLNRYLLEELWNFTLGGFGSAPERVPKILKSPYFNSTLTVLLAFGLAYPNAYTSIWPLFGTANQMMAALTLITVSLWLAYRARPVWYTVFPAIFMVATTTASLIIITLNTSHLVAQSPTPAVISRFVLGIILLFFSIGVVLLGLMRSWEFLTGKAEKIPEPEPT